MKTRALNSLKKLPILAVFSAALFVATVLAWLWFPSVVPLEVLIIVCILTGFTTLMAQIIIVLKISGRFSDREHSMREVRNTSKRSIVTFVTAVVVGNALLFYVARPSVVQAVVGNAAFGFSWILTWSLVNKTRKPRERQQ